MPSLHMPLQSGSDAVLKAMRRAYRRDRYLAILDRVRASIPDAAITTDIIVGFPGETDQDFEDTLDLVRQARFAGAFTFRYSIRPGTPAATMDGQVRARVVQERYDRLTALVEETTCAENRSSPERRSRCWSPRARAARTPPPTACPAAPATTAWSTSPRTSPDSPRPGDIVTRDGHPGRPALPAVRLRAAVRPPHPSR